MSTVKIPNTCEVYLKELHKKAYLKSPDRTLGCLFRSQLLYLVLRQDGYKPKIIKYCIRGNENKNFENMRKMRHVSGHEFPTHVVVLLDGIVLDANLGKPVLKKEYETSIIKYEPQSDLLSMEDKSKLNLNSLKPYAKRSNLSQKFQDLF